MLFINFMEFVLIFMIVIKELVSKPFVKEKKY